MLKTPYSVAAIVLLRGRRRDSLTLSSPRTLLLQQTLLVGGGHARPGSQLFVVEPHLLLYACAYSSKARMRVTSKQGTKKRRCEDMYSFFHLVMLSLLWSPVEVHSQTIPCLSFMGQTLANHSYVDISQVGRPEDGGEGVQRITDLSTCCGSTDGPHRGDWYFPDGTRLPFLAPNVDTFEARVPPGVDIRTS